MLRHGVCLVGVTWSLCVEQERLGGVSTECSVLLELDCGEEEVVVDIDVIAQGSWINEHVAEVTKAEHGLVLTFDGALICSEEHLLNHLTTLEWMSILTVHGAL